MIATVSFDFEGGIQVHEGIHEEIHELEDAPVAKVPASVIVDLDLFNEERLGFDYDLDAGRLAELLIWKLEDASLEPSDFSDFELKVMYLCVPGPPREHPTTVQLVRIP